MLKNFLTIAFRNIWRNKGFSLINILSLSIGISASLVIYLLVQHHFSFDKFHKDGDRIYRVVSKFTFSGEAFYNSGISYPAGNAVRNEVTGLSGVAGFTLMNAGAKVSASVESGQKHTVRGQKNIVFADKNYFDLFEYTWLSGTPENSLDEPYKVVLSETKAKAYFPTLPYEQILGRELIFNDTLRTTVTGIVRDINQNTDFTFTTFISKSTYDKTLVKPEELNDWDGANSDYQLLVKLAPGSTQEQIQKQLTALFLKHIKLKPGETKDVPLLLQPLDDIHFNSKYGTYFDNPLGSKSTLNGLLAVAVFLLSLACINFINLTTAKSLQRAKEIGVRKTMGGSKLQIILQFLNETFLLTLLATILSVALVPLVLKVLVDFIPAGINATIIQRPEIISFLLALSIGVSLLAGLYPAFILSRYNPVIVLKNQAVSANGKTGTARIRKFLIVLQFVIAQVFIMATLMVSHQIKFMLNKDLGFKKDAIIHFQTNFNDTVASRRSALKNKLHAIPEVAAVSLSNNPVAATGTWSSTMKYRQGKNEIETHVQLKMADTNYLKMYQLKLLAGRNVTQSDSITQLLINETYSQALGFKNPNDALGKFVEYEGRKVPVVGVIADFHQQSLHNAIKPLAIGSWPTNHRTFNIALNASSNSWENAIKKIEKVFKEVYPEDEFEYSFQDETIKNYYENERKVARLLSWSAGLAIFISCLGLLGLVIYIINQKAKEIGIRKVIGASVQQIVMLLSADFLKLIAIAFLIALPISWYAAHEWLQNFTYRINIPVTIFILTGILAMLLALITISFHALKAARANPIKSLRTE
ncbi:MAG TPA: ABC transporter permease [Pedobacter sp.]|jgi:predicted permease